MSNLVVWPPLALLSTFAIASLVLAATPGPGVIYIVARTLAQGRKAGLASVAGVALGNLGNALGASIGLAALLAASTLAFEVLRYLGAAYLLYLGVMALRTPSSTPAAASGAGSIDPPVAARRIMREGLVVALLNPKTTLFFAAFLPQFIDPGGASPLQSVLLGAAFVAIAACTDTVYVLAAHIASPALGKRLRAGTFGRRLSATVYIGLGLFTAASGALGRP